MRWHYRDPALVWLFVPAYVCHLAEEFFGGFPDWIARVVGRPLPPAGFVAINAVALVLMAVAIRAATRRESRGWMVIAIASLVFLNAVAHLLGSLATASYSPGVVTGAVIYFPLGAVVLVRAWDQAPEQQFWLGVAAGALANVAAFLSAAALSGASGFRLQA